MNIRNSRVVPLTLFCFSAAMFPSCMHTMMSGHGNGSHKPQTAAAMEKEVTSGELKAIATFPPFEEGREARLSLRLSSNATSSPISPARVVAYVQQSQSAASNDNHSMHNHAAHSASVDTFDVAEQEQRGLYEFMYTPQHAGRHSVTFEILSVDDQPFNPPIRISSERDVSAQHSSHEGGMHGSGNATVPVLIGVAAMGVMMVAMLIVGGKMF